MRVKICLLIMYSITTGPKQPVKLDIVSVAVAGIGRRSVRAPDKRYEAARYPPESESSINQSGILMPVIDFGEIIQSYRGGRVRGIPVIERAAQ